MEEETLAFRSVNRERQGWRSAWPKKPAEPDEWTPPRSWRIRVYYARSRCVSRCVSWAMSARANQWTNSSRVFSPLRHGIQHRRRSLMILCEIVIPIQIGMERNITTNPCFVPISISFSANASTDSRVKIPRLPHRSIFEYFPNRGPRSRNSSGFVNTSRNGETTIGLVEINCGDFFIQFYSFFSPTNLHRQLFSRDYLKIL